MSGGKIVSMNERLDDRKQIDREKSLRIVSKCQACLFDQIPHLIRELFDHADDDMFKLADKSDQDIIETQYFAAMRQLRKLRDSIEQAFIRHLRTSYSDFWITHNLLQQTDKELCCEDLSLVNDDELEEQLAIDGMISKAESRYSLELHGLGARFAKIARIEKLDLKDNPVGPYQFVEGFRIAFRQWEGDIGLRLVVFKIFERHVLGYTGGVYDQLNSILIEEGVLPKIKRKVNKNPVAPALLRAQQRHPWPQEGAFGAGNEAAWYPEESIDIIERMLSSRLRFGHYVPYSSFLPRSNHADDLPAASLRDLVDALTRLQLEILNAPFSGVDQVRERNREYVAHLGTLLDIGPHEAATRRMADGDQKLIDIVGMLFDVLLEQRELPDEIKVSIARLQFPMIKAAKLDVSFFGNKDHSARRLLNTIAKAVFGWTDDGDRSENSVYGQINIAVSRVLKEFREEFDVFDDITEQLRRFLERQAQRAEKSEKKVTQLIRGQEQLLAARRRVAQVIQEINQIHSKLPSIVLDFEREAWHDVMMLAYLREGEKSKAWVDAYSSLKLLIWSVTPRIKADDRQKLLTVIPALLRRLRMGLKHIGFDIHREAELFDELRRCHHAVLQGQAFDGELSEISDAAAVEEPIAEEKQVPEGADDTILPLVGQWLQWVKDGVSYRGKLTWRSAFDGLCIFVNHKGLRLADMSSQDLAALLKEGNASVIQPAARPLMDGILESMKSALNSQTAANHAG